MLAKTIGKLTEKNHNMVVALIIILALSLVLSIFSMNDWDVPVEIRRLIKSRRLKGTIIFFRKKIKHYSSSSSSSS